LSTVLPIGLPAPAPQGDGLDRPYWDATLRHELVAQRCDACGRFQWGPEWICHRCHAFDVGWAPVPGNARIYSWERVWHPVHPALKSAVPYVVLLVEFPDADGIRMIGNLAGDPRAEVVIGATVVPVFEDRGAYTLVQWRTK
jgi:hypothetical protein